MRLIYVAPFFVTFDGSHPYVALLLLLLFIKLIRDSYFTQHTKFELVMVSQLVVSLICVALFNYPFLMMYTGFTIPHLKTRHTKLLVVLYYLCVAASIYMCKDVFMRESYALWFYTAVLMIPIPMAYSDVKNYREKTSYKNNENRLKMIIKQDERDRISQELHDTLGQAFSTLAVKSDLATKLIEKKPEMAKEQVQDIAQLSRENLDLVRQIVKDMRTKSLFQSLYELGERLQEHDILLFTNNQEVALSWPNELQEGLCDIISESGNNVIKHSHANNFNIDFEEDEDNYQVVLRDDGIGFRTADLDKDGHFGISGIREKVAKLSGSLDMYSDDGAVIKIKFPRK
ncbi:MAG: sensor histidine kinase [Limosilactobacillus sp.]|uniref:sensor histidine kinase n=1 Tax=Limosilactobacillus sp. TaxID=2773925 RepID=UPI0027053E01|nr:sensor histidine kinase [Limosilactobacillus sp.]